MRFRFLSLTFLFLCAILLSSCVGKKAIVGELISPQGTTNFTPATKKFAVYLPTVPTQTQKSRITEAGTIDMTTYQSETPKVTYIVLEMKVPPNTDMTSDSNKSLDDIQASCIETAKAVLETQRSVNLNGTAGRDFTMSIAGGFLARAMIYVTPENCYQIMAVGFKNDIKAQKAEIDRVINSFRLVS